MRRLARTALSVALGAGLLAVCLVTPAHAGPQDGIGWQYSESASGYWRAPQASSIPSGGGNSGPATVFVQQSNTNELLCPDGNPDFACDAPDAYITGIICGANLRGPRGLPFFAQIRWEREIVDGEPEPWVGREADCVEPGDDDFIPMQEISWEVNYQVFQQLNAPAIQISPNARTLINLPTIVSTNYPAGIGPPATVLSQDPPRISIPIHIDRPNGGLDGEITAEADLTWTFEDGGTANGRGRPYVSGRLPENNPGFYVTNVFDRPGQKSVTLNVSWTGDVTVPPLAPEEIVPVDLPAVTEDVEVLENSPVLSKD
jgi:hypothetical protein